MSVIGVVPQVGQALLDGQAIVIAVGRSRGDEIVILCERDHPLHPYATWNYDPAYRALYTGHYHEDLGAAWEDFNSR